MRAWGVLERAHMSSHRTARLAHAARVGCVLAMVAGALVGSSAPSAATGPRSGSVAAPTAAKPTIKVLWREQFNGPAGAPAQIKTAGVSDAPGQWAVAEVNALGGGNYERQYYTDGPVEYTATGEVAHRALELDGAGKLVINARRTSAASGAKPSTIPQTSCGYGPCEFLSGRINTLGKLGFKYGLIEARIMIPKEAGTWPAFWMMGANQPTVGWPKCGEIDIMEASATQRAYAIFGSLHSFPDNGFGVTSGSFYPAKLYGGFHTYGFYWDKSRMEWQFDGKPFFKVTKSEVTGSKWAVNGARRSWPFDQEMFVILNLAMGGVLGGDSQRRVDPATSKASMTVDWIRFSSVNGVGTVIKH